MPRRRRLKNPKNAINPKNASNVSSYTLLDTLVANVVNLIISGLVLNLTIQITRAVLQRLQQTSHVGNTMPTSCGYIMPNPEATTTTTKAGIHVWLNRFMNQNPRAFTKAATPSAAKDWVSHIEKIFTVIGVDPQCKSKLAAYRLEEEAHDWWKLVLLENGGDRFEETLPWNGFRTIFFKKYCSNMDTEVCKRKYHLLRQGDDEPLKKFTDRFYRLVDYLGMDAGPPEEQAEKYQWAVCERIRKGIIQSTFSTVKEAVNAAQKVDMERKEFMAKPNDSRKRNRDGNRIQAACQSLQKGQSFGKSWKDQTKPCLWDSTHPCASCGKQHRGVCRRSSGLCYRCGETGHKVKDCKLLRPRGGLKLLGTEHDET